MKRFSRKQWIWLIIVCGFVFLALQFVRPVPKNPPVTGNLEAPDSIQLIMIKSCYPCHSNTTQFSWFDKIAPASWVVQDHVKEGRELMNFSEYDRLNAVQKKVFLFESLNQMQFDEMPLRQYTFFHSSAKITIKEIDIYKSYLRTLLYQPRLDSEKSAIRQQQYDRWMNRKVNQNVKPEWNGIQYMPDYKNWVAISTTERLDNGTMRVIVGNDVAVKAIRQNHINPWPDGSVIVKILWTMLTDSSGDIQSGELKQLDFMIRDRQQFQPTLGWGFARWVKGLDLQPYGKNALFASECMGCHQTMRNHDYIFTDPIHPESQAGLQDTVIASSVHTKEGSMSTLYGNRIATDYARSHNGRDYPAGSVLTYFTWGQRDDDHWFSARIPGEIKSIEWVRFDRLPDGSVKADYKRQPANQVLATGAQDLPDIQQRLNYILNTRASVMP